LIVLPTHLKVEIDISVALHKRAVSEAFEELRAKLLPEPEPAPMHPLQSLLWPVLNEYQRQGMVPVQNPFLGGSNPAGLQNAWPNACVGGLSRFGGGFFGQVFR